MGALARMIAMTVAATARVAVGAAWQGVTWSDVRHWGTPRNVIEVEGETVRIPAVAGEPVRVLPEVTAPAGGSHAFLFPTGGAGGGPVRYDPCQPVGYVLSPAHMPERFEPVVHAAADEISRVTGLQFVYEGRTDEVASFGRHLVQQRYGERFAPVVIGFSHERETPALAGTVTGLGGSSAVPGAYGDERYLRAGVVIIDADDVARVRADGRGDALAQAVVEHELGHVVGLAHVPDRDELMHESNLSLLTWGPGDLAGLARAGAGGCEAP